MRGPLEYEEDFEQQWNDLRKRFGGLGSFGSIIIIVVILGIWLASGIYQVGPDEVGLVKVFGRYTGQTEPGLNYHLPTPIGSAVIVNIQTFRTAEIGFRSQPGVPSTRFPTQADEALMLTSDFNIIRAETVIQYDVSNAETFAFEVEDFTVLIREASQAIIRERVAAHTVDQALTEQRTEIADEIQDELQLLLDEYGTGINILDVRLQEVTPPTNEVAEAFDDVNSAEQDKARTVNEAQRYANEQIPVAEGERQQLINTAEGYKQSRILQAEGDVARFLAVLERYRLGEDVTEARLYIETMEEILPNLNKLVLPDQGGGILPLLNLEQLLKGESQ